MLIGVLADTHGYLDERVLHMFDGVDAIIHAGDVGSLDVLASLERLAPVYAVQGNNDAPLGGLGLPLWLDRRFEGLAVHIVHQLPMAAPPPDCTVLVYGHSHAMVCEWRLGVLHLNPGAAGRRGFHRVFSVAFLELSAGKVEARLQEFGQRAPRR